MENKRQQRVPTQKLKFECRGARCGSFPALPRLWPSRPGREECKQAAGGATSAAATPPWKPANDVMAGWDPLAQAGRLIRQTNGSLVERRGREPRKVAGRRRG